MINVSDILIDIQNIKHEKYFKEQEREKLQIITTYSLMEQNNIKINKHIVEKIKTLINNNETSILNNISIIKNVKFMDFYEVGSRKLISFEQNIKNKTDSVPKVISIWYDKIGMSYNDIYNDIHKIQVPRLYQEINAILNTINKEANICIFDFSLNCLHFNFKNGNYEPIIHNFGLAFIFAVSSPIIQCDIHLSVIKQYKDILSKSGICLYGKPFEFWVLYKLYNSNIEFLSITLLENILDEYFLSLEEYLPLWNWRENLYNSGSGIYNQMLQWINCSKQNVITHFWSYQYQIHWDSYSLKFMIGHLICFGKYNENKYEKWFIKEIYPQMKI